MFVVRVEPTDRYVVLPVRFTQSEKVEQKKRKRIDDDDHGRENNK